MTPDVIADCKYRIDRLNQERNDRIERVDACLVALLSPLLPASPAPHINTESLGMAIDRLSDPQPQDSGTWTSRSGAPT